MKKILKTAVVGIGAMGRGHVEVYQRLEKEGFNVKLTAICDVDKEKLEGTKRAEGNLDNVGKSETNYSDYNKYTDINELLKNEELDYVDIVLPTYLHAKMSILALNKGLHVFCEKPMALNPNLCNRMIEASKKAGKKLMIGQCLRFWPEYEILHKYVKEEIFGKVLCAYFYRGGGTPQWSFENWLLQKSKGGGALLDQHAHDVDMINYLFGMPKYVSSSGISVFENSGHDCVSTNYYYDDGKVINAQDDWCLNGEYGFNHTFRVNFEKGAIIMDGGFRILPNGKEAFTPDYEQESAYYRELRYFINAIINDTEIEITPPESTADTIKIIDAETKSANKGGKLVFLK
jgi:predicted dehydrogenase